MTVLGIPLPLLPIFSVGDGSGQGAFSGALVPGIRIDSNNGLELDFPYYWRIDKNRDLTITPHIYTARYRHLKRNGVT